MNLKAAWVWMKIGKEVSKTMTLQRKYGLGIAILIALANIADLITPFIPLEFTGVVRAVSALISAILVALGYNSNPDGSNVRLPYEPKRKG